MIGGLLITPLNIINILGGNVLHAMKIEDKGFFSFGEAYFSTIEHGVIRGWKQHQEMTLNLIVPEGIVRFVVYDNRKDSSTAGNFEEIILSKEHYARLTVPPKLWVGFQGVGKGTNLLLNIANIPHDDTEVDHTPLKSFGYDWIQE